MAAISFTTGDYVTTYLDGALSQPWQFNGSASYSDRDDYIKVDKGSPDKYKFVIFYAIIDEGDPMIFVNTERQLKQEVKKLIGRSDVDPKSIRIFSLVGGAKTTPNVKGVE